VIVDVSLIRCFSSNFILQLLLKLEDNRLIETVGIPVEDDKGSARLTACVSSQVFVLLMNHFFFSFAVICANVFVFCFVMAICYLDI
jgi:hypothetical protein